MRSIRWSVPFVATLAVALMAVPVSAGHHEDPRTRNMRPMGHIVEPASLLDSSVANVNIHTDIAFWGKYAFQGTWFGFNIRDISSPGNPKQVSFTECSGNQGDIVVWDDILVRSWNTPAGTAGVFGAGTTCDGQTIPNDPNPVPIAGNFEGVNVFDISDPTDPALVASVETECGSHTATGVPDLTNDRLLIYNSSSSALCPGIDIIEVPLGNPAGANLLGFEPAFRGCHDTSVILGDAMMAACAGGDGWTLWSLDPADLDDPDFVASVAVPTVTIGHSAGFTWDGEVLIFGHEPGGGVAAECEAADAAEKKSLFFFDPDDASDDGTAVGTPLGMWTLPRPQSATENCTVHNFNVVPLRSDRYVLTQGSYQSGTSVVDFTDLAAPVELGYSDPPPLPVPPGSPFCAPAGCELGGVWSSYWYNNFIYETNITEGLNIFRFSGRQTAGALQLDHLNPQTQEFTH